ncbi:MAG: hypothetical protein MUC61_03350 [Amoebophilaceae bacterium]|nr:hypothetical protein [Amoebophilaceae bacterium]
MNPVVLGRQESPVAATTGHMHEEQPQIGNTPPPTTINELILTTAQQRWLDTTLRAKDSSKKRLKKLLANIAHKEELIRGAACQKAYQLLTENPRLARGNIVTLLRKVPHRVSEGKEANEALWLLCLLVARYPQLALPTSRVVLDLAGNRKDIINTREPSDFSC